MPNLRAAAVSVTGPGHLRSAHPCQDHAGVLLADSHGAAAVADGLGSRSASDQGSEVAVSMFLELCMQRHSSRYVSSSPEYRASTVLYGVASAWSKEIWERASTQGRPVSDFGTNLMCCWYTQSTTTIAAIGDCCALVDFVGRPSRLIASPSVLLGNQTQTLASVLHGASPWFITVPSSLINGVALMTDGLWNAAVDRSSPGSQGEYGSGLVAHARMEFASAVFEGLRQATNPAEWLAAQLSTESFSRSSDDDKTIAAVWHQ